MFRRPKRRVLPEDASSSSSNSSIIASHKQPYRQRSRAPKRFKTLTLSSVVLLGIVLVHASSFFSSDTIEPEKGAVVHDVKPKKIQLTKTRKKAVIFYNTYIRRNFTDDASSRKERTRRAKEIMSSQFQAIKSQPLLDDAGMFYSRFGDLEPPWLGCPGTGTCIEIAAQEKGGEEITLQHLYEYCVENPLDRVIYMHSKGTYTEWAPNDYIRDVLMQAISSDACVDMPADGTCSSCSAQLTIMPVSHYPGNMWVAECDYVKKLIPPKDFEIQKQNILSTVLNGTKTLLVEGKGPKSAYLETDLGDGTGPMKYKTAQSWQNTMDCWTGTGRFAMEHWLGSHPDFKPCDAFSEYGIRYRDLKEKSVLIPSLRYSNNFTKQNMWKQNEQNRVSPVYKLQGTLFRFNKLYNKVPDKSSWIWSVFNETEGK